MAEGGWVRLAAVAREGTENSLGETAQARSWLYFPQPCSQWMREAARSSCRVRSVKTQTEPRTGQGHGTDAARTI